MKKYLTYENFWARNAVVFIFFFTLILVQEQFGTPEHGQKALSIGQLFGLLVILYNILTFNNLIIVRKLLFEGKYFYYTIAIVAYTIALAVLFYYFSIWLDQPATFVSEIITSIITLIIGTSLYFIHTWILANIIKTRRQLLDKEAELAVLKHQISPHFLFNALNNLYGTALATPENIADKILQLSELLRYQIESIKIEYVDINEELTYVEKYLDYSSYKSINLSIENNIKGSVTAFKLPPLLFLPLIENAIKFSSEASNPFVKIDWLLTPEYIMFDIRNSFLKQGSKMKGTKTGLENLDKRLKIMNIKHVFSCQIESNNIYQVSLKVWKID